jgi:hypothetical protein
LKVYKWANLKKSLAGSKLPNKSGSNVLELTSLRAYYWQLRLCTRQLEAKTAFALGLAGALCSGGGS